MSDKQRKSRRRFLNTTGVGITGLALASMPVGTVEAQADSDNGTDSEVVIEHSNSGARRFQDSRVASVIKTYVDSFRLDSGDNQSFRIRNQRGDVVTVEITTDQTVEFSDTEITFDLYDGAGELAGEPAIIDSGDEIPVDVTGETSMFSPPPVFGQYTVAVVENDELVAATGERIYGIGYPIDLSQDGTSGEVEITVAATTEVQDDWIVELEVVNYDSDSHANVQLTSEFELEGDVLVTTIDTGEIEPLSEDTEFRDIDINFYVDGTPDEGVPNLWAGVSGELDLDIDGSQETGAAARFQDASEEAGIGGLLAGAGVVGGGGYLAYRSLKSDDEEEIKNTELNNQETKSTKERFEPGVEVSTYDELKIQDHIKTTDSYQLTSALVQKGTQSVWVLTPAAEGDKTVDTSQTEQFLDSIEPWTKMDNLPTLLTIYGHGTEPLPWLALEPGDHRSIADVGPESSLSEQLEYLTQACDGVHHIHRYGLSYESLTPDSIRVTSDGQMKLQGVIDYLAPTESTAYDPPESTDGQTAESADVYRLGSIGYEILTGQYPTEAGETIIKPSEINPKLPEEIDRILLKALSTDPDDRYETVLHLRDKLQDALVA